MRHLKRPRGKTSIRKKDLFTADEIKRIIEATGSIYERVLCEVLAETAARPGEFRSLKTSDVTMAADSVTLRIRGGKMEEKGERDVYVLNPEFIKDFSLWFKTHPNRATGSWLFYDITDATRPIAWSRASLIIKRAAATAGVNGRPIKLYLFRHSLLHELYKKYPTEAVRRAAGHAPGSPMPSVYCHADSDDIKTMLMEGRGLQHEVSEKDFILMTLRFKKHPQEFFKVMEDRLKELEG